MRRLLRWTRPVRAVAFRARMLRSRSAAARRSLVRFLDEALPARFEASGAPGLALHVRLPDGEDLVRCLGTAGGGTPVAPTTLFPALSHSKPVAAIVALALVDDGVLALDEPVGRRLTSWRLPPHRTGGFDPDGITLRRLLSHDAGLSVDGFGWTAPGTAIPAAELLARESDPAVALRLVGPPGSGLRYSGGGFAVLERLVEEATGRAFPAVARERVFARLGLTDCGFEPAWCLSPRLALGHDAAGRALPRAGLANVAGAGLFATAGDLAALFALPQDGRGVLSRAACTALLTPHARDERGAVCGLGFYVKTRRGDVKYAHAGYDVGWVHHGEGLLDRGAVTILLANGDRARELVASVAWELRERCFDGIVGPRRDGGGRREGGFAGRVGTPARPAGGGAR